MKKKIYSVLLVTAVSVLLMSCGGNTNGSRQFPPAQVTAYTVSEQKASYYVEYPATVVALNQVEIRPEVSGYLTDIYFKDGQHVTKGTKLYAIEQQQYKAAYDVAKANLDKAQQDYDRYKELAKNNAIATQILEHSLADLEAAKSNLKAMETNLRNSNIYAPFDGTIGISQVKLGSSVTAGQTLMNTISSDNPVAVDFSVDEKQISRFTDLLHKKTDGKDSTFTLVLPDQSVYNFNGRLTLMDRAVDPQTGTITARLTFPNPKNLLRPGLSCNVRVLNNNSSKSILIPYKAVVVEMGEYFVFVIHSKKVSQQKIEIGRAINDMIIVKDGLKPGEEIVTEGVQKLRDNSPVIVASTGDKNTSKPGE
jgi:RND family efflux transporter MFP subunit